MNSATRVAAMSLIAGVCLLGVAGFRNQVAEPSAWSVSEEPAFQVRAAGDTPFLIDPLGYLWVHRLNLNIYKGGVLVPPGDHEPTRGAAPGGQVELWQVFDLSGKNVAEVKLPLDAKIEAIGEDFVICTWTDESGTEYVRRYSLDRG
jgi:hypothetical protein